MSSPASADAASGRRPDGRTYCAIDFGTSNSAIAIADPGDPDGRAMRLVAVEDAQPTMPTAVFFGVEEPKRAFGRAAVAAYVEGREGRLMRSLKSILGSALVTESTPLGDGFVVRYLDVISTFLKHLKQQAERESGALTHAVIGRPVYFVDDDPVADRRAEDALRDAARAVGFAEVSFEYEPIAAARDYGSRLVDQRLVLVADIGGGTSDFTVIRIGGRTDDDRQGDVLASHGVHRAGTDFDQRVELDAILPLFGFGGRTPEGREVPNRVYHDLATWHLINSVYAPRRVAELKAMRYFYADEFHHRRLMQVVEHRLGHRLAALAEATKIDLSQEERCAIALDDIEPGLVTAFDRGRLQTSLERPLEEIVDAAVETVRRAGVEREQIAALYFTGGSTGLRVLTDRLAALFANAEIVVGDRFASVANGLALEAARRYGGTRPRT